MRINTCVLATHNKGKVVEMNKPLETAGFHVIGLDDINPQIAEIEETGFTFKENALIKALYVAEKTQCIALADDSGLEVFSLDNAPGVYSARYAQMANDSVISALDISKDAKNNLQLLKALKDKKQEERKARFCCCLALVHPNFMDKPLIAYGYWEGYISEQAEGAYGFGYDPLFIDGQTGKIAATLTPEEKMKCSHRAKALEQLVTLCKISASDFLRM